MLLKVVPHAVFTYLLVGDFVRVADDLVAAGFALRRTCAAGANDDVIVFGTCAASGVGFVTTGGTRTTRLCKPSMGKRGADSPFRSSLTCGRPQAKTSTLRIAHGVHAFRT